MAEQTAEQSRRPIVGRGLLEEDVQKVRKTVLFELELEGGVRMEVYQALTLMISFAMLVVTVLAFHKKK
ncbi:hypothetical protein PCCS19_13410 [Paenibacillus sp. CCS19]|uniref:putative holin-like toxin n=1 Tax=Paenibacillus sp. CCS19 TaxID=3158387 RepID=UPI002561E70F|nr:putative holin-like toxin [Paenibacillus cellulosilyticus]GMK38287.1 hypothetical protein PCCS19_13410 [Paenibacillus cellulosilyticus]